MNADEVRAFEQHPFCQAAVAVRQFDDAAKIPNLETPPVEYYARYLDLAAGRQ